MYHSWFVCVSVDRDNSGEILSKGVVHMLIDNRGMLSPASLLYQRNLIWLASAWHFFRVL